MPKLNSIMRAIEEKMWVLHELNIRKFTLTIFVSRSTHHELLCESLPTYHSHRTIAHWPVRIFHEDGPEDQEFYLHVEMDLREIDLQYAAVIGEASKYLPVQEYTINPPPGIILTGLF